MMMNSVRRNEIKYYINHHEYTVLRQRLQTVLGADAYSVNDQGYWIRNVYFDSLDDECYAEKLMGVQYRKKYRLRMYNQQTEPIKFEIKRKTGDAVKKDSFGLDVGAVESLLAGYYYPLLTHESEVLKRLYPYFVTKLYKPKILLDYQREAYTMGFNNIRITFDKHLRASRQTDCFFAKNLEHSFPVIPQGKMILEIKYNGFLPDMVKDILAIGNHERSAISKYTIAHSAFKTTTGTI